VVPLFVAAGVCSFVFGAAGWFIGHAPLNAVVLP
jgi:hypothetical protein